MKKNDNTTKAILAVMGLSLIGQGTYVYKQSVDTKEIKEQIIDSKRERTLMIDELTKGKLAKDSIAIQHSNLVASLENDKKKVLSLTNELAKSNLRLEKLTNDYAKLKSEKDLFKQNNSMLTLAPSNINVKSSKELAAEAKAKRRETLKRTKDSLERVKLEVAAAKLFEAEAAKAALAERKKLSAIEEANRKIEAERVKNELVEKKRNEAIEALNQKNEALKLKNEAAEVAKAEALAIAKRNAEEKASLNLANAAKKAEADRINKEAAEVAKAEALAIAKRNAEEKAATNLANAAKKAEADRINKEAADRARAEAVANAKRNEEEKARLANAAALNKKIEADRLNKEAAERAKLEAAKNEEAELARLAATAAAKKAAADKARLAAAEASKKYEEGLNSEDVALKNRLDVMAQAKKDAIEKLKNKNKADAIKTKTATAEVSKPVVNEPVVNATPVKKSALANLKSGAASAKTTETAKIEELVAKPAPVYKKAATPELEAKLTKIKITGLNVGSYTYVDENSKEEEETDEASDVKFLKVNFTIPQNFVVRASDRNYFIQVMDEDGKLVGENATENFDGVKVSYCYRTNIKYKNKAVKVSENVYIKNLKGGVYTVKVYDKADIVSESRIVLN